MSEEDPIRVLAEANHELVNTLIEIIGELGDMLNAAVTEEQKTESYVRFFHDTTCRLLDELDGYNPDEGRIRRSTIADGITALIAADFASNIDNEWAQLAADLKQQD